MRRLVLAVALGLALTGCTKDGAQDELPTDALPEVTLGELQGDGQVDVASLKGPLVVPLFANWCGPCRKELPLFERLSQEHGDEVRVLGLNYSDPQTAKALALVRDTGVTFDVIADPQGEVGEPPNPRVGYLPTIWMVDADGKVTFRQPQQVDSYDELVHLVEEHLDVAL